MIYTLKHVKSPLEVVSEVNKGVISGLCIWVNRTDILAIFLLVVSESTTAFPLAVMPIWAVPLMQTITRYESRSLGFLHHNDKYKI